MPDLVVVDTQVWSALTQAARGLESERATKWADVMADRPVVLSFITCAEVIYGAIKNGWGTRRRGQLEEDLDDVAVWWCDPELALACAQLRADSQAAGHGLHHQKHDSDRWIAATAIFLGVPLVSDDGIFRNVPGLQLLEP